MRFDPAHFRCFMAFAGEESFLSMRFFSGLPVCYSLLAVEKQTFRAAILCRIHGCEKDCGHDI